MRRPAGVLKTMVFIIDTFTHVFLHVWNLPIVSVPFGDEVMLK